MAVVNKKNIERIFDKLSVEIYKLPKSERREAIRSLEEKKRTYGGEKVSEYQAVALAIEKLEYSMARIYGEGKAKSTLVTLNKAMSIIKGEFERISNYKENEYQMEMIKEFITYVEIYIDMEVSFYRSLVNLYEYFETQDKVNFRTIETKYIGGGGNRR